MSKEFKESLAEIQKKVHQTARDKGWWKDRETLYEAARVAGIEEFADKALTGLCLSLTHSELSEALEGERKNLMSDHIEGFSMLAEEYADVIIRIMDHCEFKNIDLGEAILAKIQFNDTREYKHGGKLC